MRIRTKFLFGYLLVTSLVLAVLFVGHRANRMADQAFTQVTQHRLPMDRALQQVRSAVLRIVASTTEHLFLSTTLRAMHASRINSSEVGAALERERRLIENAEREFDRALSRYAALAQQSEDNAIGFVRDITATGQVLRARSRQLITLGQSGDASRDLIEQKEAFEAAEARVIRLVDSALAFEQLHMSGIVESSSEQLEGVRGQYAAIAVFLVVSIVGFGFATTFFISRPVQRLIRRAAKIEESNDDAPRPSSSTSLEGSGRRDELAELDAAFTAMETRLDDSRKRLTQHQETLAQRVADRTLELQRALERSESLAREARSANDAKAAFLANMSHEIRTPLNGVLGTAELLAHGELDVHQRQLVETINRCGDSLLRIINDILDFSKIDAGRLDLEVAPFCPGATLEEVVNLLGPGAYAKNIELVADIDEAAYASLLGDAGRLRQIVMNLVSNAIKFTSSGEVRLTVRAPPDNAETLSLTIEIADTGIGMSQEVQRRLFQPFSQADASTTRQFGGTGLGLAISRQLAQLMNGTLNVSSQPGAGAIFCLKIQLPRDPAAVTAPPRYDSLDVLLWQSNTHSRQATARILRDQGMSVELANSPQEAIEMANRRRFDCVIAEQLASELGTRLMTIATQSGADVLSIGSALGHASLTLALSVRYKFTKPITRAQVLQYLQLRAERQHSSPILQSVARTPHAALPQFDSRCRILLAEDNAVNRMVAMQMLKRLGLTCTAVDNGAQALRAMKDERFDLIFMDCHMPEMDGYQATDLIRQYEREHDLPRVPIIALTANALKGDRERTQDAGMDDYITKPVSMGVLSQVLDKWLTLASA